jgi:hypothetical protein
MMILQIKTHSMLSRLLSQLTSKTNCPSGAISKSSWTLSGPLSATPTWHLMVSSRMWCTRSICHPRMLDCKLKLNLILTKSQEDKPWSWLLTRQLFLEYSQNLCVSTCLTSGFVLRSLRNSVMSNKLKLLCTFLTLKLNRTKHNLATITPLK